MSEKNQTLTLICPIIGKPGKGAMLRQALIELTREVVKEPGNIFYILHETDNPDEFVIYEQWQGDEAMEFHMNTPHLQKFLADEAGLLAAEPCGQCVKVVQI